MQLVSCFLSCLATFLDDGIAFHLCDENIFPTLVGDEKDLVNLSDDHRAAANHPDTVEADYFDSGNVGTTFFYCVNQSYTWSFL